MNFQAGFQPSCYNSSEILSRFFGDFKRFIVHLVYQACKLISAANVTPIELRTAWHFVEIDFMAAELLYFHDCDNFDNLAVNNRARAPTALTDSFGDTVDATA